MKLNKLIYFIVPAIALFFVIGIYWIMGINYNNGYTRLEMQATAHQDVTKITFDKVWKVISSQAKVADRERESFKETFIQIMDSASCAPISTKNNCKKALSKKADR